LLAALESRALAFLALPLLGQFLGGHVYRHDQPKFQLLA
jgi:hypothetical protein